MAHDPKRRYYVVTALIRADETPAQTDDRVCDALGVEWGKSRITCTSYDPTANEFHKLRQYAIKKGTPASTVIP